MKNVLNLLIILCAVVFISSCKKDHSNPGDNTKPVNSYDVDANTFISTSGITDTVQKSAVNDFVVQLKKDSLWNKFMAIYPMIGGSASSSKWNLKDPRDMDAAYRLTFIGNPVFASTGVTFPSDSDYADTHLRDTSIGGYNNAAISYYSRTQNNVAGYDMGCSDGIPPFNELAIYSNNRDSAFYAETQWFGYDSIFTTSNTIGLFMLSSLSSNVTRYRNGIVTGTFGTSPKEKYTNLTFLLGMSRGALPGKKECALATIGNGLTDVEALTFYNIVQTFETKLNR